MTDSLVELSTTLNSRKKSTSWINLILLHSHLISKVGQHLKIEDRCSIRIFNKLGYSLRKTNETIGFCTSTVLNEICSSVRKHNSTRERNHEYSAKRGQQNYEINRSRCHNSPKLDSNS